MVIIRATTENEAGFLTHNNKVMVMDQSDFEHLMAIFRQNQAVNESIAAHFDAQEKLMKILSDHNISLTKKVNEIQEEINMLKQRTSGFIRLG